MRWEEPEQEALPDPPEHLLKLNPERYRAVAEQSLKDHPRDAWVAAFMMWRTWQFETQAWLAEHGLVWGMQGFKKQIVSGRPPLAWVIDEYRPPLGWVRNEYGLPLEDPNTPCPEDCTTHRVYHEMIRSLPGRKQHKKSLPTRR